MYVRRPIDRTELFVADEIGLCETLAERTLVKSIQGHSLSEVSTILRALQARYLETISGVVPHSAVELTFLSSCKPAKGVIGPA